MTAKTTTAMICRFAVLSSHRPIIGSQNRTNLLIIIIIMANVNQFKFIEKKQKENKTLQPGPVELAQPIP